MPIFGKDYKGPGAMPKKPAPQKKPQLPPESKNLPRPRPRRGGKFMGKISPSHIGGD